MPFLTTNVFTNAMRNSNSRQAAELSNVALAYALSHPISTGGAATATVTSQAKTVSTITSVIAGRFFSKAATDNFWTLSGTTIAASSWNKYALMIDTAGAASVQEATQSKVSAAAVVWTNVSNLSRWAPFLTMIGNTKIIAAVLTVATDATHTFIPGTTLLGAAGITATFIDGIDQSILPLIGNEGGLIFGNGG